MWALAVAVLLACGEEEGGGSGDAADDADPSGADDSNTTLPLPDPDPETSSSSAETSAGSTAGMASTSGAGDTTAGADDATGASTSGSPGTTGADDDPPGGSSGDQTFVVEWCNLQFPAEIELPPGEPEDVYTRAYIEGLTDITEFVDESPLVAAQVGYGPDGSMPPDGWAWTDAVPNEGWDGTMAKGGFGQENNDEYQAALSFDEAGVYDYAARFSADAGATWVYCDLDGLVRGGYTPDQAGNAVIE